MARFISKTLFRHGTATHSIIKRLPCMTLSHRHRSTKPQLIELDLPSSSGDYEVTLKLFDDLIQRILVKKATPDWLPFLPGSSFWVPPRPSSSPQNVVDLVHKLTYDLSDEEFLSLATHRGWPSSKFFLKENESGHGDDTGVEVNIREGMEGTVKVKVLTISENVAHSEDEEG